MPLHEGRLDRIAGLVDEKGFVSVKELSELLDVSEVTIRRDLQRLDDEKRLRKTFGGGVSLRGSSRPGTQTGTVDTPVAPLESSLVDRVDVLITPSVDPQFDRALIDRANKRNLPVIAESTKIAGMKTLVAVDNYHAAMALGRWAGEYVRQQFVEGPKVLDLTFQLSNTTARSQGFIAGLCQVTPAAQVVLSIDAQSRTETAYQLTTDALNVHPEINIIFAINDATAWGACRACQDLGIEPESVLLVTFGLEGDTLKDAMQAEPSYCRAGLAMFPEVVAPVCIEASIAVYNHQVLPEELITPYAILTPETLSKFYSRNDAGWQIRWEAVEHDLSVPLKIDRKSSRRITLPKRIGFVVPFSEHEWYKNLVALMKDYATSLGIGFEQVDAAQTSRDDIVLRQRAIAETAASLVHAGDVLMIDGSEVTTFLAEALTSHKNITVITNSVPVFLALRACPSVTLISTGGSLRRPSETLIGPTAETALRELRADKLFLSVSGISQSFGLSHNNIAEVAVKQAMMHAVREVILLADHSKFGQESVIQMAPVTIVDKWITDNALPASVRLEMSKLGIDVLLAET
jgi:DeoR/GlpR family transcriptional regulator of sugar metabolism